MKKRILTLVMTMILVVTQVAVPMTSFADTGNTNTPSSYGYDETPADSVTVEVTFSNDGIPLMGLDAAETPLAHLEVTVPYFDLGLYDLQQYYRYGTENGQGKYINDKVVERPTALHLYIYMLERYFLGIPEEDCGTGLQKVLNVSENKAISYYDGTHAYYTNEYNSLTLTGSATSMYMFNFWGHDENLMYYRNHRYPLMSPGWGSCADYILLSEGDRIELAMFTDWSFYHTGAFLSFDKDDYTAVPGQPLTVQVRGTATTPENKDEDKDGDGTLTPEDVKDQPETPILPYTKDDINVALYDENWERSEAEVTSNGDGSYTIQMPRRVGTYYVMATDADAGTDGADKSPGIAKIVAYDEEVAFQLKKEDAKDEIEWYVDLDDYRAAEQAVLNGIIDDAWGKIDAVTDKVDAEKIDQIVAAAKTAMDVVKTDAQLKAEEEAAHKHSYVKETVDAKYLAAEATCTEAAKYYKSCSCGEKGTDTFTSGTALGHKEVVIPGKAASCTETGLTDGKQCSVCQEVTLEQTVIAKEKHVYESIITKATTSKNGKIVKKCDCGDVDSTTTIKKASKISLSKTSATYTGKTLKAPTITVKDSAGKTIAKTNYTISKPTKSLKNVGTYTYTIKFKGNYSGSKKVTFTITPKKTSVKKLTASKKAFTVKLSKVSKQATGYEIMYATNSKFTKDKKTVKITSYKTTSKKISKLRAKKTYYVKVRTYKTVNGVKIYSDWSKAKKVTTKQ